MTELNTSNIPLHKNNISDNNTIEKNDDLKRPSICIPCVYENIKTCDIIDIFQHKLQFGEIERVDIIHKNKYDNHHLKKVFIHFKKWNHYSDSAEHVRRRLLDDHIIKVVYDNYKFWKCSASRAKYVIYN